jgi:hypothetical protein
MRQLTHAVDEREVDGGAGRRAAVEVEQRLRVEGRAPAEGVDPAEERRQDGQEAGHADGADVDDETELVGVAGGGKQENKGRGDAGPGALVTPSPAAGPRGPTNAQRPAQCFL